jgi:filamentous hemagglutinin family protein
MPAGPCKRAVSVPVPRPAAPLSRLALLAATALVPVHWAIPAGAGGPTLPAGGNFAAGAGAIAQSGASLTVNQTTNRAVIDWQSFSIGAGGKVAINNGNGATLNRVTGAEQSRLAGSLSASGSVYLVNPNGVLVLPGGRVVTGGDFVASSLGPGTAAFMQGGALTLSGTSQASVINNGDIVSRRGDVLLIARDVASTGSIGAPAGSAALVAAQRVVLMESRPGQMVSVEVPGGNVTASGAIKAAEVRLNAAGGNIYALAGNNGGLIEATGTSKRDGRVWLSAGGDTTIQSTIAATGSVSVRSGGTVAISGKIAATRKAGAGGLIDVNGGKIVLSGATLDASGTAKGGSIVLGGNKDSAGAASTLVVDAASRLLANGGSAGNGGSVSLWSTGLTDFQGTIVARGGASGRGGNAEVSSAGNLVFAGGVKLDGGGGLGDLLLDPGSVVIQTGGTTTFSSNASSLDPQALVNALASANLTVTSGSGGITVASPISWSTAGALTLNSGGNLVAGAAISQAAPIGATGGITMIATGAIYLRGNIIGTGGTVNVLVNANAAGTGGGIVVGDNGPVNISTTGNVTLGGGTALNGSGYAVGNGISFNFIGIALENATNIHAGGAVTMRGMGGSSATAADYGISVFNGTIVGSSVTLDGISGTGSTSAFGVVLGNYGFLPNGAVQTVTVRATVGDLVVSGLATPTSQTTTSNAAPGIGVNTNATLTADNGSVSLRGTNSSVGPTAAGGITFGSGDTISAANTIAVWGSAAAGTPVAVSLAGTLTTTGTLSEIDLTADRMSVGGTIVTPGAVRIVPLTAGWDINLGSLTKTAARTLELSAAEVQAIAAGTLAVGSSLVAGLNIRAPVALTTVGTLDLIAGGSLATSQPLDIAVPIGTTGGISLIAGSDIYIGANLIGTGGTVNVLANANTGGTGGGITVGGVTGTPAQFAAATATQTGATVVISTTGDVTLGGGNAGDGSGYAVGSNSFGRMGVAIVTGASVVAGGTVAIRGIGGTGSSAFGVGLFNGNITGSNVTLAGTITASGVNGIGVLVGYYGFVTGAATTASVTATTGDVTITGNALSASALGSVNAGIFLNTKSALNAPNGSVQLRGTVGPSGTSGGAGLWERPTASIVAGRTIGLWGMSTAPTPIWTFLQGTQTVTSAGGAIDITGDFIQFTGPVTAASGSVSIQPFSAGRAIAVGASSYVNAGTLSLVTADLSHITAGTLTIGSSAAGGLHMAGPVAFSSVGNLNLVSGGILSVSAPLSLTIPTLTAGTLSLIAGNDIFVNGNITGSGGAVKLLANANTSGQGGGIEVNAGSPVNVNVTGDLIFGGGTAGDGSGYAFGLNTLNRVGVYLYGGTSIVAGGTATIRGTGGNGSFAYGVDLWNASIGAGAISIYGSANPAFGTPIGVMIADGLNPASVTATAGNVTIIGGQTVSG